MAEFLTRLAKRASDLAGLEGGDPTDAAMAFAAGGVRPGGHAVSVPGLPEPQSPPPDPSNQPLRPIGGPRIPDNPPPPQTPPPGPPVGAPAPAPGAAPPLPPGGPGMPPTGPGSPPVPAAPSNQPSPGAVPPPPVAAPPQAAAGAVKQAFTGFGLQIDPGRMVPRGVNPYGFPQAGFNNLSAINPVFGGFSPGVVGSPYGRGQFSPEREGFLKDYFGPMAGTLGGTLLMGQPRSSMDVLGDRYGRQKDLILNLAGQMNPRTGRPYSNAEVTRLLNSLNSTTHRTVNTMNQVQGLHGAPEKTAFYSPYGGAYGMGLFGRPPALDSSSQGIYDNLQDQTQTPSALALRDMGIGNKLQAEGARRALESGNGLEYSQKNLAALRNQIREAAKGIQLEDQGAGDLWKDPLTGKSLVADIAQGPGLLGSDQRRNWFARQLGYEHSDEYNNLLNLVKQYQEQAQMFSGQRDRGKGVIDDIDQDQTRFLQGRSQKLQGLEDDNRAFMQSWQQGMLNKAQQQPALPAYGAGMGGYGMGGYGMYPGFHGMYPGQPGYGRGVNPFGGPGYGPAQQIPQPGVGYVGGGPNYNPTPYGQAPLAPQPQVPATWRPPVPQMPITGTTSAAPPQQHAQAPPPQPQPQPGHGAVLPGQAKMAAVGRYPASKPLLAILAGLGSAAGGFQGAVLSDPDHRGEGALRGAGLGAARGLSMGVGLNAGMVAGDRLGGLVGGALGGRAADKTKQRLTEELLRNQKPAVTITGIRDAAGNAVRGIATRPAGRGPGLQPTSNEAFNRFRGRMQDRGRFVGSGLGSVAGMIAGGLGAPTALDAVTGHPEDPNSLYAVKGKSASAGSAIARALARAVGTSAAGAGLGGVVGAATAPQDYLIEGALHGARIGGLGGMGAAAGRLAGLPLGKAPAAVGSVLGGTAGLTAANIGPNGVSDNPPAWERGELPLMEKLDARMRRNVAPPAFPKTSSVLTGAGDSARNALTSMGVLSDRGAQKSRQQEAADAGERAGTAAARGGVIGMPIGAALTGANALLRGRAIQPAMRSGLAAGGLLGLLGGTLAGAHNGRALGNELAAPKDTLLERLVPSTNPKL